MFGMIIDHVVNTRYSLKKTLGREGGKDGWIVRE